jgi:hypothetical protein
MRETWKAEEILYTLIVIHGINVRLLRINLPVKRVWELRNEGIIIVHMRIFSSLIFIYPGQTRTRFVWELHSNYEQNWLPSTLVKPNLIQLKDDERRSMRSVEFAVKREGKLELSSTPVNVLSSSIHRALNPI